MDWGWWVDTGKSVAAFTGFLAFCERVWDRFHRARERKLGAEPDIEVWQWGWLEPDSRMVRLVVRNRWRAAAQVENVAVAAPDNARLDGVNATEPRQKLLFQRHVSPANHIELEFRVVAPEMPELHQVQIRLSVEVRLKGNKERLVVRNVMLPPVIPKRTTPQPQPRMITRRERI